MTQEGRAWPDHECYMVKVAKQRDYSSRFMDVRQPLQVNTRVRMHPNLSCDRLSNIEIHLSGFPKRSGRWLDPLFCAQQLGLAARPNLSQECLKAPEREIIEVVQ